MPSGTSRRKHPKEPSLAEQIVSLCDEMLRLGREPADAGFVVKAHQRTKRRGGPNPGPVPAVGAFTHRSGPSGIMGRLGQAKDEQWDAWAAEFDNRAEHLAVLVTALKPTYDTATFYSPDPVSVWEAYPDMREMSGDDLRKAFSVRTCEGDTETKVLEHLALMDLGHKVRLQSLWTKMQWPGVVSELPIPEVAKNDQTPKGGRIWTEVDLHQAKKAGLVHYHRIFKSPPKFVRAFDQRFNALKAWAAERARQAGDGEAADGGQADALRPAAPTNDVKKLRAVAAALREWGRKAGPPGRDPSMVPDEEREAARRALLLAVKNLDIINGACDRYGCTEGVACAGVFDELRTAAADHRRGSDLGGYWCWAHDLTGKHLPGNVSFPDELDRWASRLEQEPAGAGQADAPTEEPDAREAKKWVKRIASEVSDLVRNPDILKRFREMMDQWQKRDRKQTASEKAWQDRRRQHFERLAGLPPDDPQRAESTKPPKRGWVWEGEYVFSSGEKEFIWGWVPPGLAQSGEPEVELILPLEKRRSLDDDEKYMLLAVVHDEVLRGVAEIAPWPGSILEAIPYAALCYEGRNEQGLDGLLDHIEDAEVELRGFLEDVKEDLRKCGLLPPKEAGAERARKGPGKPKAHRAARAGNPKLDVRRRRIWVKGKWYDITDEQKCVLSVLIAAKGAWVQGRELGTRPDKTIKAMPKPVQRMIESRKGTGYGYRLLALLPE